MNYSVLYDSYKELFEKDGELTELGQFVLCGLAISLAVSFIECFKKRKEIL